MRASVVLPTPGGPHNIKENKCFSSIACRRGFPAPTRCSCPTNSPSVLGRIRTARGSIYLFYTVTLFCTVEISTTTTSNQDKNMLSDLPEISVLLGTHSDDYMNH